MADRYGVNRIEAVNAAATTVQDTQAPGAGCQGYLTQTVAQGPSQVIQGSSIVPNPVQGQHRWHVALFLISPRHHNPFYRRSYTYQFGDEFKGALNQTVQEQARKSNDSSIAAMMLGNPAAAGAILPSVHADRLQLTPYDTQWSFVMIVDQPGRAPAADFVQPAFSQAPSRLIYSGYVNDEPVSQLNPSNPVMNPNAVLKTTHCTRLDMDYTMHSRGCMVTTNTKFDKDFVDPLQLAALIYQEENVRPARQSSLLPDALLNAQVMIGDDAPDNGTEGFWSYQPRTQQNQTPSAQPTVIEVSSGMGSPAKHLASIVGAMTEAARDVNVVTQPGPFRDTVGDQQRYVNYVAACLKTNESTVLLGANGTPIFQPRGPINLGELITKCGSVMDVQIINVPFTNNIAVTDAGASTAPRVARRNQAASIVSNSLPALMAQLGIADIQFRYNSTVANPDAQASAALGMGFPDQGVMAALNRGIFHPLGMGTLVPLSPEQHISILNTIERMLRVQVFAQLYTLYGDFDVMVHASLAGSTFVNVNLMCDGLLDATEQTSFYETDNSFGGINSGLVGNQSVANFNGANLADLVMTQGRLVTGDAAGAAGQGDDYFRPDPEFDLGYY